MRSTRLGVAVFVGAALLLPGCGARSGEGEAGEGDEGQGSGGDRTPIDDPGAEEPAGTGGRPNPDSTGRPPTSSGGRRPAGNGGSPSVGGNANTPGGCAWGDAVICRCTETIYGVMDCLPDRSAYGPCRCGGVLSPRGPR